MSDIKTDTAKQPTTNTKSTALQSHLNTTEALMQRALYAVNSTDTEEAKQEVSDLREKNPQASTEKLASLLVQKKVQQAAAVGFITTGPAMIPGIGTFLSLTLGVVADVAMTMKLQAEMVLELAALYDYDLEPQDARNVVALVTGVSLGVEQLASRAGGRLALRVGEHEAETVAAKAIPFVGPVAAAGVNAASTYIIGKRAQAYFQVGPEAVGSWADSMRVISGVDERKVWGWLKRGSSSTQTAKQSEPSGTSWIYNLWRGEKKGAPSAPKRKEFQEIPITIENR